MTFLLSFLRSFRGVSAVVGGTDTFQHLSRALKTAKIALICFAISMVLLSLSLLIISTYFVMQIVDKVT